MIPGWIARIVDKKGPLGQKRDLKLANKNHFWAGMESRKIQLQFNRSPETAIISHPTTFILWALVMARVCYCIGRRRQATDFISAPSSSEMEPNLAD